MASTKDVIAKSLEGDYRPEHLFALRQSLAAFRYYQRLVDKRLKAFIFMGGPQSTMEYVLSSDSPRMASARKTIDMAKVEQNLKANAWADPGSYANKLGPAPALFQYGLHDEVWVPLADAKDYFAMSSGPKSIEFYDADHALNEKARMNRDDFLNRTLHLQPGN